VATVVICALVVCIGVKTFSAGDGVAGSGDGLQRVQILIYGGRRRCALSRGGRQRGMRWTNLAHMNIRCSNGEKTLLSGLLALTAAVVSVLKRS